MRIRLRTYLLPVLLGGWGLLPAQNALITGIDPAYSGSVIHVVVPGNPFVRSPGFYRQVTADEQGAFRVEVPLEEGTMVELETGRYEGLLYAEPGGSYEVTLPPFSRKSTSDQISPFFEPRRIPLKVKGKTAGINRAIYAFDSVFTGVNEEVIFARRTGNESNVDSIIAHLEARFKDQPSPFFRNYRKYRYGILKLNQGTVPLEMISRRYLGPRVEETNPAFLELFHAIFRDFLIFMSRTEAGAGIRTHINRVHHPDSLRRIIAAQSPVWGDTLTEMVLLQSLSDLFYRGGIHKESILNLLDSLAADPVSPAFKTYTIQLRDKLSSLVIGHRPPPLLLRDLHGDTVTLGQFGDRYVYLMFCTPENYGCMIEYPFLQSYHQKHSDYLQVVTVMVAGSEEQVRDFMERNEYRWKALYFADQSDLLDNYMVRALPTAYLIGPGGKLVLSPASLPSENFEQQLFRIMRSRGDI